MSKLNGNSKKSKGTEAEEKRITGFVIMPAAMVNILDTLKPTTIKVYIAIRSFKPNHTENIGKYSPSIPKIKLKSGIKSRDTINKAIDELVALGFIIRRKTTGERNDYIFPKSLEIVESSSDIKADPDQLNVETSAEQLRQYLTRKQSERPEFTIQEVWEIWDKFIRKCVEYPKMKKGFAGFDKFFAEEFKDLSI